MSGNRRLRAAAGAAVGVGIMVALVMAAVTRRGGAAAGANLAAAPRPYENQDKLLAGFLVDQIVIAAPPGDPHRDAQWQQISALQSLISHLRNEFGSQIASAFRAEAARRKVSLGRVFPEGE